MLQDVQGRAAGAGLLRIGDPGVEHQLQQMGKTALVRPLNRDGVVALRISRQLS